MQPLDQRRRRRLPVDDVGAEAARVEHEPHRVAAQLADDLRLEQRFHQPPGGGVGQQDVPVPVEHDRRVGLLLAQDEVERAPHLAERRRVERGRAIDGRVAGGDEQVVTVAQRDVEHAGQQQHHLAAGLRPSGLDEAQVARGHAGLDGELELAHPALRAPLPEQPAEARFRRRDRNLCHARDSTPGLVRPTLPRRSLPAAGRGGMIRRRR